MTAVSTDELPAAPGAPTMLARAVRRSDALVDAAMAELSLDEALRLDEQERALVLAMLEQAVESAAATIASGAARLLGRRVVEALTSFVSLHDSGLLRDRALIRAVIDEARTALIDEALVATRAPDETPMLLARLSDHSDPIVRDGTAAYLLAESRRGRGAVRAPELPPTVAQRLGWTVAAVLAQGADLTVTHAVGEATRHYLETLTTQTQAQSAARMLAAALDPSDEERAAILLEALAEGRLTLFAALVAHMGGIDMEEATAATLDVDPEVLLTILHSCGLEREALARIGLRLADADRGRDPELLADVVDAVAALSADAAATRMAPLALDADFRAAVRRLDRVKR